MNEIVKTVRGLTRPLSIATAIAIGLIGAIQEAEMVSEVLRLKRLAGEIE